MSSPFSNQVYIHRRFSLSKDKRMRLWSLHPRYLDPQGLVALWREALLAQAVLRGATRGYRNHPQLVRFRDQDAPLDAMALYLQVVHDEAEARGYHFDRSKFEATEPGLVIQVTSGQMDYEWGHLMAKLRTRNPGQYQRWENTEAPEPHPLFQICPGEVAPWERPLPP